MRYYGAQKASGRPLPKAVAGVEDDPLQMGGDFQVPNANIDFSIQF